MTRYQAFIVKGDAERQEEAEMLFQTLEILSYEVVSADAVDALYDEAFVWDAVDESVLDISKDRFELRAYFDETQEEELKRAVQKAEERGFEVAVEGVEDTDWANDWKKYFHPIAIDETLSIVPSWEDYEKRDEESVIILDPGMAFGSGNHPTSYLCSRYLRRYLRGGETVIDIGCGSGILSLVAAVSGADPVIAVDMDPQSVEATKANAEKNGMDGAIDTRLGDLFSVVEETAEVVVSNIFAEVIIGMLGDVKHHVKVGGIYIASGILKEKRDDVLTALRAEGFEILDHQTEGDWSAVAARRMA